MAIGNLNTSRGTFATPTDGFTKRLMSQGQALKDQALEEERNKEKIKQQELTNRMAQDRLNIASQAAEDSRVQQKLVNARYDTKEAKTLAEDAMKQETGNLIAKLRGMTSKERNTFLKDVVPTYGGISSRDLSEVDYQMDQDDIRNAATKRAAAQRNAAYGLSLKNAKEAKDFKKAFINMSNSEVAANPELQKTTEQLTYDQVASPSMQKLLDKVGPRTREEQSKVDDFNLKMESLGNAYAETRMILPQEVLTKLAPALSDNSAYLDAAVSYKQGETSAQQEAVSKAKAAKIALTKEMLSKGYGVGSKGTTKTGAGKPATSGDYGKMYLAITGNKLGADDKIPTALREAFRDAVANEYTVDEIVGKLGDKKNYTPSSGGWFSSKAKVNTKDLFKKKLEVDNVPQFYKDQMKELDQVINSKGTPKASGRSADEYIRTALAVKNPVLESVVTPTPDKVVATAEMVKDIPSEVTAQDVMTETEKDKSKSLNYFTRKKAEEAAQVRANTQNRRNENEKTYKAARGTAEFQVTLVNAMGLGKEYAEASTQKERLSIIAEAKQIQNRRALTASLSR